MDAEISELLDRNIQRVENLVSLYGTPGPGRRKVKETDILRAALVLLHASMEDFLRSLLISNAARFDQETLNGYPLPGGRKKRPEKFFLGDLANHRGKTVDDLITEAVTDYLEEFSSFNDLGEVKKALKQCGIADATVDNHNFRHLPAMIERRHKIVHKADRNENVGGRGNHQVQTIGSGTLNNYVDAVKDLKAFVEANLP